MASLEPPSGDGKKPSKYVSVMVEHQKTEFMICTLEPERNLQIALDHMFVAGEEVTFFLNGEGTVHLTGYLVPDDYDDYDEDLEDEEDEDEEVSDADSDSVKLVSTKRKNEALESSPEAVGKKAKVDSKLAKDSPNKTLKVEEKESINALKKKNEEKNFNKNLNDNKVSKIVPQNNKESDESEDEDDSDEDEEESDQEMDESLGLIDREAVEAEESDDEEDESSDESGLNYFID
jgi:FK506-binding nuclear protein